MANPWNMPAQDPLLGSFAEEVIEAGHEEELENEKRGCGHLQHNALYVRSDVQTLGSTDGTIPPFVALDEPLEYREHAERGAIVPDHKVFPGVEFSLAYLNEGFTTTPSGDMEAHLDRLRLGSYQGGEHYGEVLPAKASDILMSVGQTNWEQPEAYIDECRRLGLNLKIGASPQRDPPAINPLRTRCWVVHPQGAGEDRAAIIGYAVLTRAVFTTGKDATADDPDIPRYVEDWYKTGKVDLATPGPQTESPIDRTDERIEEYASDE